MRRMVLGITTLLSLLTGCSAPAGAEDAEDWVRAVCGALTPWRSAIAQINQGAARGLAGSTTPEEAREHLLDLVSDARDATELARAGVAAAGVPPVAGGEAVSSGFVRSLEQTRDAYASARTELLALSTDDETAFYDGVVAVLDRLTRRYEQAGVELADLESTHLREAFDREPACR